MRTERLRWAKGQWQAPATLTRADCVLYFGGKGLLEDGERFRELAAFYPAAHLVGCSTGGEIFGKEVADGTVVALAIALERSRLQVASASLPEPSQSFVVGAELAATLAAPDLKYVFLLSDGLTVNGAALLDGFYSVLPKEVVITGGLAGDGDEFVRTFVGCDAVPQTGQVAAIGFYGEALELRYGCAAGWRPFGPPRRITKASGTEIYELDGKPALGLYKEYLGEEAAHLPGSALMFPLAICAEEGAEGVVRGVLGVNEERQSVVFGADVPEGHLAQLMRGDTNSLIDGALQAASLVADDVRSDALALVVSCVGRKLLLRQYTQDEIDVVCAQLHIPLFGFYSHGEICPVTRGGSSSFHNQTMTITLLAEKM